MKRNEILDSFLPTSVSDTDTTPVGTRSMEWWFREVLRNELCNLQ